MKTQTFTLFLFLLLFISTNIWASPKHSIGRESVKTEDIKVYPNPIVNKGTLKFNLEQSTEVKVELFDISGKIVDKLAEDFYFDGTNTISFDVQNYKEGIYFLKISTDKWIKTTRILIRK